MNIEKIFASNVFTMGTMKEYLDPEDYAEVKNVIKNGGELSLKTADVVAKAMKELREFMFERVYKNPEAKSEESKAEMLIQTLYSYYRHHLEKLP